MTDQPGFAAHTCARYCLGGITLAASAWNMLAAHMRVCTRYGLARMCTAESRCALAHTKCKRLPVRDAVGAAGKELFFPSNYVKKVPKLQRPKKPAMPPTAATAASVSSQSAIAMPGLAPASTDGSSAYKPGGLLKQALHAAHDGDVIAPKKATMGVSMFGPGGAKAAGGGGPSDELAAKLAKRRGES